MRDNFDEEYALAQSNLSSFGEVLNALIKSLLELEGLHDCTISWRVKSKEGTFSKLARTNWVASISSLSDILGIRIVTNFRKEADAAGKVIEREFLIDSEDSLDRNSIPEQVRFGYSSLHYVCQLSSARAGLPEYLDYKNIRFEIQVRSMLQDFWDKMDHKLGYEFREGVPKASRRRYARMAGLMELADDEFQSMHEELRAHERTATAAVGRGYLRIKIDRDSLRSFTNSEPLVGQLDEYLAEVMGRTLPDSLTNSFIERQIPELARVGFETISDIRKFITSEEDVIREFGKQWLLAAYSDERSSDAQTIPRGISLFYIVLLRDAKRLVGGEISEDDLGYVDSGWRYRMAWQNTSHGAG
jgi:putative GTP pyrophosphokinase